MKVIIQVLICCTVFGQLYAQQKVSDKYLSKKENTTWKFFEESERVSVSELAKNKTLLELGTKDELKPISNKADKTGMRHYRYQQIHNGIPVEWAVYLMREKDARVTNANGSLIQGLNIPSTPSISEARALQTALQYTNAAWYAWEDDAHEHTLKQAKHNPNATFYPSGELVIIDPQLTQQAANCRLAYKFDIYAVQPLSRQVLYIDAHSGEVLKAIEKIHSCTDVPASGETNYSGTVSFTACYADGEYTLKSVDIGGGMQVFDGGGDISLSEIPCQDPDGHFDTDAEATEVHWATQKTYEYLLDTHGRNSIDSSGASLLSWVHYGNQLNNAYWNGAWMLYGDGDGINFTSFTSPDIVAHEIGHGLTDHTSNLIYEGESGALNESFSDIFGEVIEKYSRGSNDWIVGADFTLAPKNGLRNMANPNDPTMTTRQPDTYLGEYYRRTGFADHGGVHTNSGVPNHWFYLLSEGGTGTNDNDHTYDIEGIGMAKAAAIAYANLTTLLPNADFEDARLGAIQAAENLYGADEALQVDAAWCAVGVGPGCVRPDCRMIDSLALVALYNSTNGANWENTWDLAQPMHSWYRVTTNEEGCVIELNLSSNDLNGSIPAEIGNLNQLESLRLSSNQLSGSIPSEIGNFTLLNELNLSSNQLSGSIPSEIGNFTLLNELNLSSNQLSGSIPSEIGNFTLLNELNLSSNQLSGSIPSEIGNFTLLNELNLSSNQLSGSIPSEIGNLTLLNELNLSSNQLSGSIPSEIGNFTLLNRLNLSSNQLSGSIPQELGNLKQFQYSYFNLSDNQLSGCFDINLENICLFRTAILSGNNFISTWENFCDNGIGVCSIEPCLNSSEDSLSLVALYNATNGNQWTNQWELTQPMATWYGVTFVEGCLIGLSLSSNQLSGSIPPEIGNLTLLNELNLSSNQLSGSIPQEVGNLTLLNKLNLSSNQLSSSIPQEIGNLTLLNKLNLSSNQLSGSIPQEIGNPTFLNELNLSFNQLSGSIPPEIGNPTFLNELNLSFNQLSGSIPPEIGNPTFLNELNLSFNQLSGSIPPEIGPFGGWWQPSQSLPIYRTGHLDLSSNQLSGSIPLEIRNWKLEFLDLSSNELSGSIPTEIGNLSGGSLTRLLYLNLSLNELSGSIPTEIGNLSWLLYLNLSQNELSGSIPAEIGNLNQLEQLYLSSNQLSGCFDQNLSNLCNISSTNIDEGNNFDATWDAFCMYGDGICIYTPTLVLPGDFNNDGIADKADLIYWGLAKGYTGHTRPDSTSAWIPQDSPEWDASIGGINSKHQDADGNGIINEADLAVLEQNYGESYEDFSYSYNASPAIYTLRQVAVDTVNGLKETTYELYLQANTPINTHGISASVEFKDSPTVLEIRIDTTGSVLQPSHYIEDYNSNDRTIAFALTRTDKSNQLIDGPITKLVVMDKDVQIGDPSDVETNSGKMMSATGVATSVGGSTLHGSLGGANPTLPVFLATNPAYCQAGGAAEAFVSEGTPPYAYIWSTGATSSRINDLDIGRYSVTVSDADDLTSVVDFEIDWAFTPVEVSADNGQICFDFEETPLTDAVEVSLDDGLTFMSPITEDACYSVSESTHPVWIRLASDSCTTYLGLTTDYIDVELYAWLEGAYNPALSEMRTTLGTVRKLLPGQTPTSNIATPTPAGQPYSIAPWNYTGTEGTDWTDADYTGDETDWVLVSFRTDIQKNTEVGMAAGLLQKDGSIVFPNRCVIASTVASPLYIVVEHRNHIGVMTPQPINLIDGTLTYDFRLADSYREPTGVGQKQLPTSEWVMYAGDVYQMDFPSFDINGMDKTIWLNSNGIFDDYLSPDLNLDGDVNGQDKPLWFENNGISSRVPK